MAATRMPNDFDGILVGYPGFNLPKARSSMPWTFNRGRRWILDITKAFSRDDMALLSKGILSACDALDGLKDGIVGDPDACEKTFRIESLQCKSEKQPDCLSAAQVTALLASHAGPRNSKGEQLYSAWTWDPGMSSNNWRGQEAGKRQSRLGWQADHRGDGCSVTGAGPSPQSPQRWAASPMICRPFC